MKSIGVSDAQEKFENFRSSESKNVSRVNTSTRVELTERDLEVFEFLADMKFSTGTNVFRKFFKHTKFNESSKSEAWAKKRLFQLERAGFLRSEYSHHKVEKYFFLSRSGYRTLTGLHPEKTFTKFSNGIDFRTLEHDSLVTQFRLDLEEKFKVTDWISDRKLKTETANQFGLTAFNVPDGIYTLPSGEIVAFELEIAQKSKRRYVDKVEQFVKQIRGRKAQEGMFRSVHFVCFKDTVVKALQSEVRMYSSFFKIESASSFDASKGGSDEV